MESEHPDDFAEAVALVHSRLPTENQLSIPWGDPPLFAVARFGTRIVTERGDTPAAALRDLARQLPERPSMDDTAGSQ